MKFGFPLALVNRITLPSGVTGRIPFDVGLLQAPNHEAFAVHEIRFYCDMGAAGAASGAVPNNYQLPALTCTDAAPFLRVSIRVGPYLVCDSVPMWAIGAARDNALEGAVWRFPLRRPLFIPPGMGVVITAERRPQTVGGVAGCELTTTIGLSMFLSATLVGRVVTGDFPRTTSVPYVSAYAPDAVANGSSLTSGAQDLVNSLSVPVDVHYALGRIGQLRPTVGGGNQLNSFSYNVPELAMLSTLAWKTQAIFHDAEFHVAFDPGTRVLNLAGLTLPSGERLTFKANAPTSVTAPTGWFPVVGIIADRKENV